MTIDGSPGPWPAEFPVTEDGGVREGLVVRSRSGEIEGRTTGSRRPCVKLRSQLVATGVRVKQNGVYRLAEDYLFRSPSTAAMTLLSRNANGRLEWKDAAGVTLKDHQIAASGGESA